MDYPGRRLEQGDTFDAPPTALPRFAPATLAILAPYTTRRWRGLGRRQGTRRALIPSLIVKAA